MGFADNERKGIGAWSEEAGETKGKRLEDERKERRGKKKNKEGWWRQAISENK